jgi:hypothetical protein
MTGVPPRFQEFRLTSDFRWRAATAGGLCHQNSMFCGLPVSLDLLGMLLEIDGETGMSGRVADEVEVFRCGRMQRCPQCRDAGVADGPRGRPVCL